eukprot:31504-Pelagococcus_subviridis.AAC.4
MGFASVASISYTDASIALISSRCVVRSRFAATSAWSGYTNLYTPGSINMMSPCASMDSRRPNRTGSECSMICTRTSTGNSTPTHDAHFRRSASTAVSMSMRATSADLTESGSDA